MTINTSDIIAGIVIIIVGAAIVTSVKSALKGMLVELDDRYVKRGECQREHERMAEERESIRTDIQNHEDRLREAHV